MKSNPYETYKKQFRAKQAKLKSQGLMPRVEQLSKTQFEYTRQALINEREAMGKKPGNTTRDIINQQFYGDASRAQARALKRAAKELGFDISQQRIRLNAKGDVALQNFWKTIQAEREELRKAGLSAKEINITIGMEYFGS